MRSTYRMLGIFMALLLVSSNMAFSGHISSHPVTDSGQCSLCIHAGGSDNAISSEPGIPSIAPAKQAFDRSYTNNCFVPVIIHGHQSRAPPHFT